MLSKCIFDLLIFNSIPIFTFANNVVICFQNVSLIYWYSTFEKYMGWCDGLWFAFKMYLWFIDIQQGLCVGRCFRRCDLLSKCIFDLLIFNRQGFGKKYRQVVICFQNVSLIYWYSTDVSSNQALDRLWFAFKMYLWFIDIQQILCYKQMVKSCDLLSKCIFDLLIFNSPEKRKRSQWVVICFQNVSLIYWYSTK